MKLFLYNYLAVKNGLDTGGGIFNDSIFLKIIFKNKMFIKK